MSSTSRRCVSFAPDCKPHDGMSERNALVDAVIKRFFFDKLMVTERHVVSLCPSPLAAFHLYHDLLMLSLRIKELAGQPPKSWVPVLPHGGGKCAKLFLAHLPLVQHLVHVAESACKRMYRKKAKSAADVHSSKSSIASSSPRPEESPSPVTITA